MGMDFQWHSDHVIHVRYLTKVESWDHYHQVNEQIIAAIKERRLTATQVARGQTEFYVIHTPGRVAMPKGNPLPHLQRVGKLMPSNVVVYAVVENYFAKMMMEICIKALQPLDLAPKMYFASSFRDALHQIATQELVAV